MMFVQFQLILQYSFLCLFPCLSLSLLFLIGIRYILLVHRLVNGGSVLLPGAFWFGSVVNSLLVFLPGSALGTFALELKPAFLLNVPYVIVPLSFLARLAAESSSLPPRRNVFCTGPLLCWLLALASLLLAALSTVRLLAVLSCPLPFAQQWLMLEPSLADPLVYPAMQALVDFFYRAPAQLFLAYTLFQRSVSPAARLLAWLNLGAASQGVFSYSFTAFRAPELLDSPIFLDYGRAPLAALLAILVLTPLLTVVALELSRPIAISKPKAD